MTDRLPELSLVGRYRVLVPQETFDHRADRSARGLTAMVRREPVMRRSPPAVEGGDPLLFMGFEMVLEVETLAQATYLKMLFEGARVEEI